MKPGTVMHGLWMAVNMNMSELMHIDGMSIKELLGNIVITMLQNHGIYI